ncbi:winged helix-turn-helix transcriptional regulator [Leisingera sp. F5]|uniref:winged helix-turn-helix transcriptional regulator n=1 Tax=Leisingera sp. F5 TaxID=1813816 RepID=UPI000A6DC5C4|nr:winged helix-turn-helix transcriptional regulator [Leisingera sp. F5]
MDINALVNITARAWALPVLAHLHEGVPGRQAALLQAAGAGRTALGQSLDHLIRIGLVERNPGHGHPLRPEFRLTPAGQRAAETASRLHRAAGAGGQDLLRRAWTVPVLASLQSPQYFNDISRSLLTITDRALSQSLKSMEQRSWIERSISAAARPPRALYRAVNTGGLLSRIAGAAVTSALR